VPLDTLFSPLTVAIRCRLTANRRLDEQREDLPRFEVEVEVMAEKTVMLTTSLRSEVVVVARTLGGELRYLEARRLEGTVRDGKRGREEAGGDFRSSGLRAEDHECFLEGGEREGKRGETRPTFPPLFFPLRRPLLFDG
jgi:hypothetical protein